MKLTEKFWRNVKYTLLLQISILLLYIILVKYLIRIPDSNIELLEIITRSEELLDSERAYALRIEKVAARIKKEDFSIHNVQRIDEIQKDIDQIGKFYKANNNNSRFTFALIANNVLQILFNSKRESSSLDRNQVLIDTNLKECKANIN
ncbi:MAG: type VI secretion system TssO [Bacteroidota bacterium]